MSDLEIGFAAVGGMLVLMALRLPIGLALGLGLILLSIAVVVNASVTALRTTAGRSAYG